jgi:primosomal protein N' (replication factor Y)
VGRRLEPHSQTGSLFADALEALAPAPEPALGTFVQVVLDRPLAGELTYRLPPGYEAGALPGTRVVVPLGSLREIGVVVARSTSTDIDPRKLKSVLRVLEERPLLSPELLELTRQVAANYACTWGEALHAILPAAFKREGGRRCVQRVRASPGVGTAELAQLEQGETKQHRLLRTLLELQDWIEVREVLRQLGLSESPLHSLRKKAWVELVRAEDHSDPLDDAPPADRVRPRVLSTAQQAAIETVSSAIRSGKSAAFLLEGVTGSGKTEVYLRSIECALELRRGAIVLVPEIALTPQTVGWFRSRFGRVAVFHSRMTDAQRHDTWRELQSGRTQVVVGARSALFAPVPRLGVLVVDEEHEPSFKQDSTPRYHARDVAQLRARLEGAVCLLGSATPSLESWSDARAGRIGHLRLPERVTGQTLPPVEIVDLRGEPAGPGGTTLFSRRLRTLLEATLSRGEQSILFLNRRGFAPVSWCLDCKTTQRCAQCDVALAWHKRIRRLVCHACCEEVAPSARCATCGSPRLRLLGAGSERVEHELAALFPAARVRRMDSDTMRRRADYEQTLAAFGEGRVDVLVGTQMIAKGLDFPRVTLVGIVNADTALHLPDFRSSERTFQLIAQVAGRAGRGQSPGRIVVQTTAPEHPAVRCAARHAFDEFASAEVELRRELGYPPHGKLVRLVLDGLDEGTLQQAAEACARGLEAALGASGCEVLGPAPAPIAQLRGRFRYHLLVKLPLAPDVQERVRRELAALHAQRSAVRTTIDVDPVSML